MYACYPLLRTFTFPLQTKSTLSDVVLSLTSTSQANKFSRLSQFNLLEVDKSQYQYIAMQFWILSRCLFLNIIRRRFSMARREVYNIIARFMIPQYHGHGVEYVMEVTLVGGEVIHVR